jgi:uncharacterized phage protein (TIGR01671 family)
MEMREIKFRVWEENIKQMFYNVGIVNDELYLMLDGVGFDVVGDYREFKLMQFTGLKDKNGKEIYEGDIIHSLSPFFTGEGTIHDYDDDYYEVVWMEEEARFCLKKKNGLYAYVDELIEPTVKGNIFENPEILEEQHG